MLRKILEKYRAFPVRHKLVAFGLLALLTGATAFATGAPGAIVPSIAVVAGLCLVTEMLTRRMHEVVILTVVAFHLLVALIVSATYASFTADRYGAVALAISFIYMMVTTGVLTLAAVRWSIGRLWVTLMFVYLGIDLGGVVLMMLFGNNSLLFIPLAGALVLIPRCVYWRSMIKRRGGEDTPLAPVTKSTLRAQDLLCEVLASNKEDVTVRKIEGSQQALVAREDKKSIWYLHPVHVRSAMEISPQGIKINNQEYSERLYKIYQEGMEDRRANKIKRKRVNVAVVLTNSENDPSMKMYVAPKGYKRNKKLVEVLPMISLLRRIEQG